ncbi:hypothetical protein GCM10010124_05130 [Pilimelia terevasa]|uniref:Uncharacterized protein n=1 Tax=Pilimelia terevasa TaxID=53372 RepID=A0A8J3BJQ6_9ACTN|nr:hypothetical protein GCM10010124_05130 [Pilimelia terevasa]
MHPLWNTGSPGTGDPVRVRQLPVSTLRSRTDCCNCVCCGAALADVAGASTAAPAISTAAMDPPSLTDIRIAISLTVRRALLARSPTVRGGIRTGNLRGFPPPGGYPGTLYPRRNHPHRPAKRLTAPSPAGTVPSARNAQYR